MIYYKVVRPMKDKYVSTIVYGSPFQLIYSTEFVTEANPWMLAMSLGICAFTDLKFSLDFIRGYEKNNIIFLAEGEPMEKPSSVRLEQAGPAWYARDKILRRLQDPACTTRWPEGTVLMKELKLIGEVM